MLRPPRVVPLHLTFPAEVPPVSLGRLFPIRSLWPGRELPFRQLPTSSKKIRHLILGCQNRKISSAPQSAFWVHLEWNNPLLTISEAFFIQVLAMSVLILHRTNRRTQQEWFGRSYIWHSGSNRSVPSFCERLPSPASVIPPAFYWKTETLNRESRTYCPIDPKQNNQKQN